MDGAEAVCPRTFGGAFATVVVVALEGAIAQLACCCSTQRARARILAWTLSMRGLFSFQLSFARPAAHPVLVRS